MVFFHQGLRYKKNRPQKKLYFANVEMWMIRSVKKNSDNKWKSKEISHPDIGGFFLVIGPKKLLLLLSVDGSNNNKKRRSVNKVFPQRFQINAAYIQYHQFDHHHHMQKAADFSIVQPATKFIHSYWIGFCCCCCPAKKVCFPFFFNKKKVDFNFTLLCIRIQLFNDDDELKILLLLYSGLICIHKR